MTIHKQYLEYHEIKDLMFHRLKMLNRWSVVMNVLGITSLVYLVISLFANTDDVMPLVNYIGHALVYRGEFSVVDPVYNTWVVILAKLFGFMIAICFMVMGTYIVYYKTMIKVETI